MNTYGFISLGLIGGSIARAIREKQPEATIIAYNRSPESLDEAIKDGVVNEAVYQDKIEAGDYSAFAKCDLIFLCSPVQKNEEFMEKLKDVISADCILTDVGSTKTDIHKKAESLGITKNFIGGHPMAGSERVGYSNSKASLLQNAYYILTPTKDVAPEKVSEYKALVESTGALALVLDYDQHDYIVAAISHLPHVIAASLVNLVKMSDYDEGLMKMVAAGGFKDITRIASSSANMWQQICLTNTENIRKLLKDYINYLKAIDEKLELREAQDLYDFFEEARIYRDSFQTNGSGPIKNSFSFTLDIPDIPGAIAKITALIAEKELSIKNIGITHAREYQGGDLNLEFWTKENMEIAQRLLTSEGYTIHK